jgi:lysophospholipase L1-like esterase
MNTYDGNILRGKKWCACGDSFTHGYFDGMQEEDALIKEGRYQGQYMVYPYIIGSRNDMEITMNAYNGASLAECGRTYDQTFIRGHYKDIPLDSDYITLSFGINDWHQNVPLGTMASQDPAEFCGAWNILMSYLLNHYPYAHIGIIVPNGTVHEYTDAVRAMAVKWGIPSLDMEEGRNVPLMHRAERTGVCQEALAIRMRNFIVGGENRHPNPAAHEYESTFIENFLRTL